MNISKSVFNSVDSTSWVLTGRFGGVFCEIGNYNKINVSEKKVLVEMLANPGKAYSREEIGKISGISQERSIDVMITRLRQKIETNPKNPKYLHTIRGSGYVLWIE